MGGGDYAVYYSDILGFYGINKDSEPERLFMWTDVGLTKSMINDMIIKSESEIYVKLMANSDNITEYGRIDRLRSDEVAEKIVIRIAYDVTDTDAKMSSFLNYIGMYNRQHRDSRVELVEYIADDTGGLTVSQKLANDLSTENAPDIVLFNHSFSYEMFASSDVFYDLYDYIDKDAEYKRSSFLPCLLKPFESTDGKLYSLITEFSLISLAGKMSTLGDRSSWTVDDLIKFEQSLDPTQSLILLRGDYAKGDGHLNLLKLILKGTLTEYIDYQSKRCDFTGIFTNLLGFCKNAPVTLSTAGLDPSLYAEDKIVLSTESYLAIVPFLNTRHVLYSNGNVSYIGFPAQNSTNGTVIEPNIRFAITKQSDSADEAWDFIKFYLQEQQHQWDNPTSSEFLMAAFPCTNRAIDTMLSKAKQIQIFANVTHSIDPLTKEEHIGISYSVMPYDSEESPLKESAYLMDDTDASAFWELLNDITLSYTSDDASVAIILEEASAYYAGTATLDETIARITDRVETRLNE